MDTTEVNKAMQIAEKMGEKARNEHRPCLPHRDEKLLQLKEGKRISDCVPIFKSYIIGYNRKV